VADSRRYSSALGNGNRYEVREDCRYLFIQLGYETLYSSLRIALLTGQIFALSTSQTPLEAYMSLFNFSMHSASVSAKRINADPSILGISPSIGGSLRYAPPNGTVPTL